MGRSQVKSKKAAKKGAAFAARGARRANVAGAKKGVKVPRREPQAGRGEAHKAKVSYTIDAAVEQGVNEFAAANDVSASSVVNEALAKFLRRQAMKELVAENPPTPAEAQTIVEEWKGAGFRFGES